MRPVQGISSLEGHNLLPAELAEFSPELAWRIAKVFEGMMWRELYPLELSSNVDGVRLVQKSKHSRMLVVLGTEDRLSFLGAVRFPNVGHGHDGKYHPFGMS